MEQLKVSIITTTYNSEEFLNETIESVRIQNYKNLEYIIIDGGSSDNTVEIIKQNSDIISYWISEEDKGIYDAINKGINIATGDIIKIINSDDLLLEGSIEKAVSIIQEQSHLDDFILVSSLARIDSSGQKIAEWDTRKRYLFFENLLHPSWYVPARIYKKYGLYELNFKIASDYEYYLKLLSNKVNIIRYPKPFTGYREGGTSSNFKGINEIIAIKSKYKGKLPAFFLYLQINTIKLINRFR